MATRGGKYAQMKEPILKWIRENGLNNEGRCPFGATLADLLRAFGLDRCTWKYWIDNRAGFREAVHDAEDIWLGSRKTRLVSSLFRVAEGYESREVTIEQRPDDEGNPHPIRQTLRKKPIPPSVEAIKYILSNSFPDEFNDKSTLTVKTDEPRSIEELNAEIARLQSLEE